MLVGCRRNSRSPTVRGDPTAVKSEDGKYLDKEGNPTYKIAPERDRGLVHLFGIPPLTFGLPHLPRTRRHGLELCAGAERLAQDHELWRLPRHRRERSQERQHCIGECDACPAPIRTWPATWTTSMSICAPAPATVHGAARAPPNTKTSLHPMPRRKRAAWANSEFPEAQPTRGIAVFNGELRGEDRRIGARSAAPSCESGCSPMADGARKCPHVLGEAPRTQIPAVYPAGTGRDRSRRLQ